MNDYVIIEADNKGGYTIAEAQAALARDYPEYHVLVEENGEQLVATLAKKSKVGRQVVAEDEDALDLLDDAPPAPKKKDEEDSSSDDDDSDGDDKPAAPKKDDDDDSGDSDGEDKGDGPGGDPVSQVLDALNVLEKALPKIKDQLKPAGGPGLPPDAEGLGPLGPGGLGGPGGLPGGPGGPAGLGGPPKGPGEIGPTPGAPPAAAGGLPGMGPGGPAGPKSKPDLRKRPPTGVPAFAKNKVIYRPLLDRDGSKASIAKVAQEISEHPRYGERYEVVDLRVENEQWAAYLRLREE